MQLTKHFTKLRKFRFTCLIGLLSGLIFTSSLQAQQYDCAFDTMLQDLFVDTLELQKFESHKQQLIYQRQQLLNKAPGPERNNIRRGPNSIPARYIIPVVVHVIHDPSDSIIGQGSNISVGQIENQIEALNQHFRNADKIGAPAVNTGIQFCLATKKPDGTTFTGITRRGDHMTNIGLMFLNQVMNFDKYPEDNYLNIWIISDIQSAYGNPIGLGKPRSLPGSHGVVVEYKFFGDFQSCFSCNLNPASRGKTLTHEVGHYLGLFHTHQSGCVGTTDTTCEIEGDLCCDVAPSAIRTNCVTDNTCTEYPVDLMDAINNYMSYTDDFCRTTFTKDQTELMYAEIILNNATLVEANNIKKTGADQCDLFSALFSPGIESLCDSGSIDFVALEKGKYYRWKITNSTDQSVLIDQWSNSDSINPYFNIPGNYDIQLTVIDGSDSITYLRRKLITIFNCGVPLKTNKGNWYFGEYAGLRFTTGATIPDYTIWERKPGTLHTVEGVFTVSNDSGNLLFYGGGIVYEDDTLPNSRTDSLYIYDRNHDVMPHGSLLGSSTSAQSCIAIPHPTKEEQYYLISCYDRSYHNDPNYPEGGLRWSIIDTSLNGGLGDVDTNFMNIPVPPPPGGNFTSADTAFRSGECFTVIPQCEGNKHWLITGDEANDSLRIFSVDNSGIVYHKSAYLGTKAVLGQIFASPDGTKVCAEANLFDFDTKSGTLTFSRKLGKTPQYHIFFGCFSPNSEILYYTFFNTLISFQSDLFQVDLVDSNMTTSLFVAHPDNTHFQIGPDGKIYIAQINSESLGVINHPNTLSTLSTYNTYDYERDALKLSTSTYKILSKGGLPSLIIAEKPDKIIPGIKFTISNCTIYNFSSSVCCGNSYEWDFGDGETMTGKKVKHTYTQQGIFIVSLVVDGDTIRREIPVGIPKSDFSGDTVVCDLLSNHAVLNYDSTLTYYWETIPKGFFNTNTTDKNRSVDVIWPAIGQHQLKLVTTNNYGCSDTVIKDIHIKNPIQYNTISKNSNDCQIDTIIGSDPWGGNFTYTYQWRKYKPDSGWVTIAGATQKDLYNAENGWLYARLVESDSCFSTSNYINAVNIGTPNIITQTNNPCNISIEGTPVDTIPGILIQWQYRLNSSSSWINLVGDTNRNFVGNTISPTQEFRRQVEYNNCVDYGNVIIASASIYNNFIRRDALNLIDPCIAGASYSFAGTAPTTSNSGPFYYEWQYSADGVNWNLLDSGSSPLSGGYASHSGSGLPGSFYMRRIISIPGCDNISNVLNITPHIYITDQPDNWTACNNTNGNLDFEVGIFNDLNLNVSYQWQYQKNGNWYNFGNNVAHVIASNPITQIGQFNVRCIITTPCGDLYSDTAILTTTSAMPVISTHPGNQTGTEGNTVLFSIVTDAINTIQWQISSDSGSTWTDIIGETNTILSLTVPSVCENGNFYRAVVSGYCGTVNSNSASLTINALLDVDLWIKDLSHDVGAEPFNDALTNFTHSPDIWVRWNQDNIKASDPTQSGYQYPVVDNGDLYVYATIRNDGTDASTGGEVFFYWTLASTGEVWEEDWIDVFPDNYFHNLDSGQYYLQGNEIGSVNLPSIPAGGSVNVWVTWPNADIPRPENFYVYRSGSRLYKNNQGICFLTRIVTCNDEPFGMTYPETTDLSFNVPYNNNIASKNTLVTYIYPPPVLVNTCSPPPLWIPVRNNDNTTRDIDVLLSPNDMMFYNIGEVVVYLDDYLETAWHSSGANGSGFTFINSNTLLVSNPTTFSLTDIPLDPGEEGNIGLSFIEKPGNSNPGALMWYYFDLWQQTQGNPYPDGSVHIYFEAPDYASGDEGEGEGGPEGGSPITEDEENDEEVVSTGGFDLRVFPNPAKTVVNIEVSLSEDATISLELVDQTGQQVKMIFEDRLIAKGQHIITENVEPLAEGVYMVLLKKGEQILVRKFIVMD